MTERAIRLVAAGAGEVLDVLGAPMVVKADPATMGLLLVEHEVPPGYAVPPHVHDAEDEVFQVLAGTLTFVTDAGEARGGPGATMLLPAGIRHGFRNEGPEPAQCLVMVTPGVQAAALFRHLDRAGRAGPLVPEQVGAICAQYGVRIG